MTDATRPKPPVVLIAMMVLAALALVGSLGAMWAVRPTSPEDTAPPGPQIPAFTLTDQNARPIDESILDGQLTVVDFIFTSCPLYCPAMTQRMQEVQDQTTATGARFLSFSIDGEHDTPERLTLWGDTFGADFNRWTFATGPQDITWAIARTLGYEVAPDDTMQVGKPDGSIGINIVHPTSLLLVGPDRRVIERYSYDNPDEIDALIQRLREGA